MLPDDYAHKKKLEDGGYTSRQKVRSQLTAGAGQLKKILDVHDIEEIRQYEATHVEETTPSAPTQHSEATRPTSSGDTVTAVVTENAPVAGQTGDADEKKAPTTEVVNLSEARMFKGQIYGPGQATVPVEFAESLRRQKLIQ